MVPGTDGCLMMVFIPNTASCNAWLWFKISAGISSSIQQPHCHTHFVCVSDTTLNDLIGLGCYLRLTVACSDPAYAYIQWMSFSICVYLCNRCFQVAAQNLFQSACVYIRTCACRVRWGSDMCLQLCCADNASFLILLHKAIFLLWPERDCRSLLTEAWKTVNPIYSLHFCRCLREPRTSWWFMPNKYLGNISVPLMWKPEAECVVVRLRQTKLRCV